MNTNELARAIGNQGTSIHRRVCLTGSYYGLRPIKLPNGRLLWPDDAVEQLIAQRSKKQEANQAADCDETTPRRGGAPGVEHGTETGNPKLDSAAHCTAAHRRAGAMRPQDIGQIGSEL